MTAILIGMLADEGKLQWKLSVAEALPEIPANSARRKVTIWNLVAHQSGLGQSPRVFMQQVR